MRIGVALLGVLVFVGATYGVVTMLKGYQVAQVPAAPPKKTVITDGPVPVEEHSQTVGGPKQEGALKATKETYIPPISSTGPWPKAVIEETEYKFGRMEVGEERTHDFVIRNEGEADLEIAKGNTTCQCTISEVDNNKIPPGGSATITLRWKPTVQSEAFEKGAEIRTNDPKNKAFHLKIVGMVVPRLVLMPSENWEIREVNEGTPSTAIGFLISPVLENLEIEKVVYDESRMEVKLHKAELDQVQQMQGKSGYGFEVLVKPGMPVGTFSFPIKIYTNTFVRKADGSEGDQAVVDVNVTGRREGPIKILGTAYVAEGSGISLGSFAANEGKSVSVMLLVRGAPEEGLKFLDVQTDPKFLKVTLDPESKAVGSARRYMLHVAFPPGEPRGSRREETAGTIQIKTNHSDAGELSLKVHFTAF